MRRPSALVILIAIASTSTAAAAERQKFEYEVVVQEPYALETVLRDRLGYGYACTAVARPDGMTLTPRVAVIVAREKDAEPPRQRDVRVIASSGALADIARRLDASAAQGFGVCGLALAARRGTDDYTVVAVLTRTTATPTGVSYRVLETTGRRDEWAELQKSAADGFAVTHLASRPQPLVSSTSDVVLIAEKTAASQPLIYGSISGGNEGGLQKDLDKATARGFCALATYPTAEWMAILLSKPLDAPCDRPHQYNVDEGSEFMGLSVNGTGTLLGIHHIKEKILSLYDEKGASLEYTVEKAVLADEDSSAARQSREHRWLTDKLNADGGGGYLPLNVAWRPGKDEGTRAIEVILARKRD